MESSKAKIEKFFGSNEKLKAIANNKEFIEKMAEGQATPETYQRELGKLGLELTLEEAKEIQTATERAMDISPGQLDEAVLENIAGGSGATTVAIAGAGVTTVAAGLAAAGCSMAGIIYQFKTRTALKYKDSQQAEKYNRRSLQLWGASVGLATGAVTSGILTAAGIAGAVSKKH